MGWNQVPAMFDHKSIEYWNQILSESFSVHFYASSHPHKQKIMRQRFYGKQMPLYTYLGPNHCPLSFFSEPMF